MKKVILIILMIALLLLAGCSEKAIINIKEIQPDGSVIDAEYDVERREYYQMEISSESDTMTSSVPLVSNKHFLVEK